MGRLKIAFLLTLTTVLSLFAMVGTASACVWSLYQPEPPKRI
ncbi:MAG: cyclic lactone autoinducer peptide [Desulforudis sp.]|nr:MAG: cyclic lactone autoinducer peptide [Desulforudis sp.]